MKTKAAIHVETGKPLVVDYVEIPDPRPDQVIVKLTATGVCHSQLHQIADPRTLTPNLLGHEASGIVTHVGSDVTDLAEGDRAIVTWVSKKPTVGFPSPIMSGVTYNGEPVNQQLVSAWAEDILALGDYVVRIDKDDPGDVSCIVGCAVLTGAGAVMNTARVRPGDTVAVFGVGGVGLSAVQMAALLEAKMVIAVDLDDGKLEFARQFGATHTVNASHGDPVEAIIELTGGGADFAFDTIGVRATTEQILSAVREGGPGSDNFGGTAVLVGIPGPEMTIDPNLLVLGQRQYRGSLGATNAERDFELYLRWHREGKFPLEKLVTRRYSLDQINEACDALRAGEILGRAIVEF